MCPEVNSASVSTRDFSWGKGGQCVWLTTYHPCSAETSRKSGALTYPEPLGPPWSVAGRLYFTLYICFIQFLTHFFKLKITLWRPFSWISFHCVYIKTECLSVCVLVSRSVHLCLWMLQCGVMNYICVLVCMLACIPVFGSERQCLLLLTCT